MPIDKMSNPAAAANLYANTLKSGLSSGIDGGDKAGKVSFGDILKQTATKTIDSIRQGEKASAQAITGQADLADVVQSVSQAELTLQTVIAVRDRMIGAYQEIMRMPM